jgi:hypothetical protein
MGNNTYFTLNSAQTTDEELSLCVDRIVSGLFSVAVTMGSIPIIRCPKQGAAEMVAIRLDRKLRDHILNSKDQNLFSGSQKYGTTSRPLLFIVDRNIDLVPMLSHSWTYASLVHDVLKMRLGQIEVEIPADDSPNSKPVKKQYDLKANDAFWSDNANEPFPTVAENIDSKLVSLLLLDNINYNQQCNSLNTKKKNRNSCRKQVRAQLMRVSIPVLAPALHV